MSHRGDLVPTRWRLLIVVCVLSGFLAWWGLAASQATGQRASNTFTVDVENDIPDLNPGDGVCAAALSFCSLRAAVMEANASDGDHVIILPAGTYRLTNAGAAEDAAVTGDLDITDFFNTLVIRGAGPGLSVINGEGIDRVFQVLGSTTLQLEGLTVVNGRIADDGGGIWNGGTLRISDSTISGNWSVGGSGSGIYNRASTGGFLGAAGTVELTDVRVTGNFSGSDGGGIWNGGSLTVQGSTIDFNSNNQHGGGESGVMARRPSRRQRLSTMVRSEVVASTSPGGRSRSTAPARSRTASQPKGARASGMPEPWTGSVGSCRAMTRI